jgi:hypothetical protein
MDEESSKAVLAVADRLSAIPAPLWFGPMYRGVWAAFFLQGLLILTALPEWALDTTMKMVISVVFLITTIVLYAVPLKTPRKWFPDYASILIYSLIQTLPTLINNIVSALLTSLAGTSSHFASDFVRVFLSVCLSVILNITAASCTYLETTLLPVSNAAAVLSFAFLYAPRQFLSILFMEPEEGFGTSFFLASIFNTAIMVGMQAVPILVLTSPGLLEHQVQPYTGPVPDNVAPSTSPAGRVSSARRAWMATLRFCQRTISHLFIRVYCEDNLNTDLTRLGRYYPCRCCGRSNRKPAAGSTDKSAGPVEKEKRMGSAKFGPKQRSNAIAPFPGVQKSALAGESQPLPQIGVVVPPPADQGEGTGPEHGQRDATGTDPNDTCTSHSNLEAPPLAYPPWEPLLRSPARGLYKARTSAMYTLIAYVVNFLSIVSLIIVERILRDANLFVSEKGAPLFFDVEHRQVVRGLDKAATSWAYVGISIGRLAVIMLSGVAAFAVSEYIMFWRLEKRRGVFCRNGSGGTELGAPSRRLTYSDFAPAGEPATNASEDGGDNTRFDPIGSAGTAQTFGHFEDEGMHKLGGIERSRSARSMNSINSFMFGDRGKRSERLNGLFKLGWQVDWKNGYIRYDEISCLRVYEQAVQPNVVFLVSTCVYQLVHMTLYR